VEFAGAAGGLPPGFGATKHVCLRYPVRPAVGQTCPKRRRTTRDGGPWHRRPSGKPPATPRCIPKAWPRAGRTGYP